MTNDFLGPYQLGPNDTAENGIYTGDAVELLPSVPTRSVDLVIADPPYNLSTKSDGMGKINPWGDRVNTALWFTQWIGQVRRIIKPEGALWTFSNWRSLATMQKCSDDLRWPIESVLIWDKCWIGPGGTKGLRPSYELVLLFAGEAFAIGNRAIADIQRFKWSSHKPNGHPAEKPLNLIYWLSDISLDEPGIILDPFVGSGTSAVAARMGVHQYLAFEIDLATAEMARERVRNTQPPLPLDMPIQESFIGELT